MEELFPLSKTGTIKNSFIGIKLNTKTHKWIK